MGKQYQQCRGSIKEEKMNVGIKFKIPNEHGNYLKQIFNKIDSNNYIWKIKEAEVYINGINDLFERETYRNEEFKDIITKEKYYTVFANITLYEREDKVIIHKYEDFIKSSCILVMLITDNEFVEIYSKNENILKIIYQNAIENNFSDIQYIIEGKIKRKEFSAYKD